MGFRQVKEPNTHKNQALTSPCICDLMQSHQSQFLGHVDHVSLQVYQASPLMLWEQTSLGCRGYFKNKFKKCNILA